MDRDSDNSDASIKIARMSRLHASRLQYTPPLPPVLRGAFRLKEIPLTVPLPAEKDIIQRHFPCTWGNKPVTLVSNSGGPVQIGQQLNLGVVFSGGPAPGGHNVISGLYDFLHSHNIDSVLYGFLGGPSGLIDNKYITLTFDVIAPYRNQGGFHLLGSGRTKIETPEQFSKVKQVVQQLDLQGIVVVGGDDSNSNAAFLAEYFLANGVSTKVIGVPKTIDGDLRNEYVECSFGFDTATKVYSELIANLALDASSAKKSYHLVRLMGRNASHITLECALQTHPNVVLIGEEVKAKKQKLSDIVNECCNVVCNRAETGKQYGLILLPEGLIDFMEDISELIKELNEILHFPDNQNITTRELANKLSKECKQLFEFLPNEIRQQLLLERDPHGNVQVSKIETERLLAILMDSELVKRKKNGKYKGTWAAITHFLGYEGRCSLPSQFDCNYCYTLGFTAAALIEAGQTGLVAGVTNLIKPVTEWNVGGVPLTIMMTIERRNGKDQPVIKKELVELNGKPFKTLAAQRQKWGIEDDYRNPGSIQHYGPLAETVNFTLLLEREIL